MTEQGLSPHAVMSLLHNADKAIDVIQASRELGLLEQLDQGPVTLRALSAKLGLVSGRLYKLLECLESLGFVKSTHETADLLDVTYSSRGSLAEAAELVFGPNSIERERDKHGWRAIYRQLPAVLRGDHRMPPEEFQWPHRTLELATAFEASMAATVGPAAESFLNDRSALFGKKRAENTGPTRLLDVGGGDGTLGLMLLRQTTDLAVDVYNLPVIRSLVEDKARAASRVGRLGFVGGNFLTEPLPKGYEVISFVRVLFDWPADVVRMLLEKAFAALPPGGRLIICEEFRSREQLALQFFWTYFLIGVDSNTYRLREKEHYLRVLTEVGFQRVSEHPGSLASIIAQRP